MSHEPLAGRFLGFDLQHRRVGFGGLWADDERHMPWRARLLTAKNENAEYRLTAYGQTREEAENRLVALVEALDAPERP